MSTSIEEGGTLTKKSLNIKNLYLDPNNYRFADEVEYVKIDDDKVVSDRIQKRTRAYIEGDKREGIRDLLESFKTNGFLKVDVIQLRDLGNNYYLVIEGNRRVTALKCLQDDFLQGKDIGKLSPSVFKSVPAEILPMCEDPKEHLIIMGLKHINGNKKWAAINQSQLLFDYLVDFWGDPKAYSAKENELCKSLGLTKQRLRSSQRAIHLINKYRESDYGDQFRSEMYSIFEEITKKGQIREWLEWDDDLYQPQNIYRMERLFSWISKADKLFDEETDDEVKEREPIIDKASEIRLLADFINSEDALQTMEYTESVTIAYQKSGIDERANIEKSLDNVKKNIKILKRYSDVLEDADIDELVNVGKNLSAILPARTAIDISSKNVSFYWNGGVHNHFSSIEIKSYHKFKSFKIEELKRINLFAGKNNTGKTTILETLYLLCQQNDLNGLFEVSKIRRKNKELFADYLVDSLDDKIELSAIFNDVELRTTIEKYVDPFADKNDVYMASYYAEGQIDGDTNKMTLHTYEKGNNDLNYERIQHLCKAYFSSPYYVNDDDILMLYNNAAEAKCEGETALSLIIEFIKEIDPSIKDIQPTIQNDKPVFFVDSDRFPDKTVDLSSYGDGIIRIFEMALSFASCKNGVLLIDEIETAIHFSLLVKYTEFLQKMAELFNVQVFITTHSKECIDAFVKNDYRNEDISAYRLSDLDNEVDCKYIKGEDLEYLVKNMAFDMRGGIKGDN